MTISSAPKRERRQSRTKNPRVGWNLFCRPWFLKLLVALAPFLTKVVELVIALIKQQK